MIKRILSVLFLLSIATVSTPLAARGPTFPSPEGGATLVMFPMDGAFSDIGKRSFVVTVSVESSALFSETYELGNRSSGPTALALYLEGVTYQDLKKLPNSVKRRISVDVGWKGEKSQRLSLSELLLQHASMKKADREILMPKPSLALHGESSSEPDRAGRRENARTAQLQIAPTDHNGQGEWMCPDAADGHCGTDYDTCTAECYPWDPGYYEVCMSECEATRNYCMHGSYHDSWTDEQILELHYVTDRGGCYPWYNCAVFDLTVWEGYDTLKRVRDYEQRYCGSQLYTFTTSDETFWDLCWLDTDRWTNSGSYMGDECKLDF